MEFHQQKEEDAGNWFGEGYNRPLPDTQAADEDSLEDPEEEELRDEFNAVQMKAYDSFDEVDEESDLQESDQIPRYG